MLLISFCYNSMLTSGLRINFLCFCLWAKHGSPDPPPPQRCTWTQFTVLSALHTPTNAVTSLASVPVAGHKSQAPQHCRCSDKENRRHSCFSLPVSKTARQSPATRHLHTVAIATTPPPPPPHYQQLPGVLVVSELHKESIRCSPG